MKKNFSLISLFGIISLSCNVLSPKISETPEPQTSDAGNIGVEYQDGISIQEFSLDNVNSIPAEDVLLEVIHFGSGGPGDAKKCENFDGDPIVFSEPIILFHPADNEFMSRSSFITCGWQPHEKLKGTIIYPEGTTVNKEIFANEIGSAVLEFAPDLDSLEDVYMYVISDDIYTLKSNAFFYSPRVPRLYYLNENQILFNNFPPNSIISLYMFSKSTHAWWKADGGLEFQVNNDGELIANLPNIPKTLFIGVYDNLWFLPIDNNDTSHNGLLEKDDGFLPSQFGEEYFEKSLKFRKESKSYRECTDKTYSIFEPIDLDQQNYQYIKTSELNLYNEPRYSSPIVKIFNAGQPLKLLGGPFCFDNAVWWAVTYPDFSNIGTVVSGYVVEIDEQNNHYLERQSCGDLPTRLNSFNSVLVSYANGNNKNLRQQPGFSQEIIDRIPEGTLIRVSEHWCVDDTYWWKIYTQDNQEGWMTEMQDGVYFLEPAPK